MRGLKLDSSSPVLLSLLHLLPSLLLIGLVVVGIASLEFGEKKVVLGAQTTQPQVRTLTVEDRIKELSGLGTKIKSEAIVKARDNLK
jgi:hypothetical protein